MESFVSLRPYVILGINAEGKRKSLTITIGDNESAEILAVSPERTEKSRSKRYPDLSVPMAFTGIKERISAAFPKQNTRGVLSIR